MDNQEEAKKIVNAWISPCSCDKIYTSRGRHSPYCVWAFANTPELTTDIASALDAAHKDGELSALPKGRAAERDSIQAEINAGAITPDVKCSIKPPKNHIIDEEGTIREIIGILPITGDGRVAGIMNQHIHSDLCKSCGQETPSILLWHPDFDSPAELHGDYLFVSCTDRPISEFYTSKEAANKAKTRTV